VSESRERDGLPAAVTFAHADQVFAASNTFRCRHRAGQHGLCRRCQEAHLEDSIARPLRIFDRPRIGRPRGAVAAAHAVGQLKEPPGARKAVGIVRRLESVDSSLGLTHHIIDRCRGFAAYSKLQSNEIGRGRQRAIPDGFSFRRCATEKIIGGGEFPDLKVGLSS
jgi:hypothetical protein